jgi:hypothetical protein
LTATTAGPVVLTGLQLRGNPLVVAYTVQVSSSDSTSVAEYGPRSFPNDLAWCSVGDAQAVLDVTVALRSQPLPQVQTRFMVATNTARAALLGRDLSDRVTIVEPESGLSGDFYVETIRHELTGTHDHTVTFGCEAVPAELGGVGSGFSDVFDDVFSEAERNLFRFDTLGAGFDDGLFGSGLDLAATMFRFDNALQGFDLGTFSL